MGNFVKAEGARLLRRVVKHILEVPARYYQDIWVKKGEPGSHTFLGLFADDNAPVKFPECGTVACLGAWINQLTGAKTRKQQYSLVRACRKIGVSPNDANVLFGMASSWPEPFRSQWENANTSLKQAHIAQRRVEHFIKTGL